MIRLSYVLDEEAYLAANHAMWRKRRSSPRGRYTGYALLATLPLCGWLAAAWGMYFTFMAAIAANALHWFFDWPLTRAITRRRFADMPSKGRRIGWKIDEKGLRVSAGDERGLIRWDMLQEAWEGPDGFVLSQPGNVNHWLPFSAFDGDSDIERMRGLIARHLARKQGS